MLFANRNQPLTLDQIRQVAPSALAIAPHDSRSHLYAHISTGDLINAMEEAGFLPYSAKQSGTRDKSRIGHTKHMIRFRHVDTVVPTKAGENFPEVVMINAHDGTSAYRLLAGIFRLICGNGLMIAESLQGSVHVPHKGNVIDQVIEGSLRIAKESQKALGAIERWSQIQLSHPEAMVLAEEAHTARFADADGKINTPIRPIQLLEMNRSADRHMDLYTTLNRVQENVIRGGLTGDQYNDRTRRMRRVTTRAVKGIDQDVKLNQILWRVAEKMEQIKTGYTPTPAVA
jgi:hypothetical protein